jgi:hypothetical protein
MRIDELLTELDLLDEQPKPPKPDDSTLVDHPSVNEQDSFFADTRRYCRECKHCITKMVDAKPPMSVAPWKRGNFPLTAEAIRENEEATRHRIEKCQWCTEFRWLPDDSMPRRCERFADRETGEIMPPEWFM